MGFIRGVAFLLVGFVVLLDWDGILQTVGISGALSYGVMCFGSSTFLGCAGFELTLRTLIGAVLILAGVKNL